MTDYIHKTVLLKEAVEFLNCQKGKLYIDATAGGGGHSFEIAKKIYPEGEAGVKKSGFPALPENRLFVTHSEGRLVMLDTDSDAISAATLKLEKYNDITTIIKSNYSEIPDILKSLNIDKINGGILFDLGVSFHQLTSPEKGFSFQQDSFLDMRIDLQNPLTAYDIVNKYPEDKLYKIFREFGEEWFPGRIAKKIVTSRKLKKITTTKELATLIENVVPFRKKIHPATRVFQALRIAVNNELEILEKTLNKVVPLLNKNARIVVISFHSLEDRLVKNTFKHYSSKCICTPDKMICKCSPPILKILTKKPVIPGIEEIKANPSARSAKMRAAEGL